MKVKRWVLVGAGASVGFLFGARAGRERFDQLAAWSRKNMADFGVKPAVDRVVESAKMTADGVRDAAAATTSDVLDAGSKAISERLDSAGENLGG
jgi:hypothetical protein